MRILAIETSCDETAAAIYDSTAGVMSSVLYSQVAHHSQYGGVVPEIASRHHITRITDIVDHALRDAQCTLQDVDALAVTTTPGLPGSLSIGIAHAKALAYATHKPLIAVDHIEGHVFSAHLEHDIPFPYLCLTVSGGHTALYRVEQLGTMIKLGGTRDDAAGEAFDKVAKLLNLGYPGGPRIESLARAVDYCDTLHYPRLKTRDCSFSFSGLKTAVLYDLIKRGLYDEQAKTISHTADIHIIQDIASSFLCAVGDILVKRLSYAYELYPDTQAVAFVGGVACNSYLRKCIQTWCATHALSTHIPSPKFCTDNAAMIAFVGHYRAQQGRTTDLTADVGTR